MKTKEELIESMAYYLAEAAYNYTKGNKKLSINYYGCYYAYKNLFNNFSGKEKNLLVQKYKLFYEQKTDYFEARNKLKDWLQFYYIDTANHILCDYLNE